MATENNFDVDMPGFIVALDKQKERSRAAGKIEADDWVVLREDDVEEFIGYDYVEADTYLTKYRRIVTKGEEFYQLVFRLTPFYPEGGGQVGDTGYIDNGFEKVEILDTKKENNLIIHFVKELPKDYYTKFKIVVSNDRNLTACNHSATHLMHQALREILGNHVEQKGSLVNSEYLRFDFSHFEKVNDEQIQQIEDFVNEKIQAKIPLNEHRAIPITKAEEAGAMMLFGEKYGDVVRMIEFGDSKELCGGIHVNNTSEIELFKIISEGSVAAGIRRIEAMTSKKAAWWLKNKIDIISALEKPLNNILNPDLNKELQGLKQSFIKDYNLVSNTDKLVEMEVSSEKDEVEIINKAIAYFTKHKLPKSILEGLNLKKKELTKAGEQDNKEQVKAIKEDLLTKIEVVNEVNVIAQKIDLEDSAAIKDLAFQLKGQVDNLFMVLGAEVNGKPNLTIVVSEELSKTKNLHAGNIIREAAKEMRGGGGGQPFYATAGGSNVEGIQAAITKALSFIG
jgi:alanyl-tRNA synthetase